MSMPRTALEKLVPVYAQGFFTLSPTGIYQVVIYEYIDREKYYHKIVEDDELYTDEIERLRTIIEDELAKELIKINEERAETIINGISIAFHESPEHVSLIFFVFIKGVIKNGINIYEDYYESTKAEYDYDAYWFLPPSWRILEVVASGRYDVYGPTNNMLIISARRGDDISGYEKIVFEAVL